MMKRNPSSIDILYRLGMYETMCLQTGSNSDNRWYLTNDKLRFRFGNKLEEGDRVRYHYA